MQSLSVRSIISLRFFPVVDLVSSSMADKSVVRIVFEELHIFEIIWRNLLINILLKCFFLIVAQLDPCECHKGGPEWSSRFCSSCSQASLQLERTGPRWHSRTNYYCAKWNSWLISIFFETNFAFLIFISTSRPFTLLVIVLPRCSTSLTQGSWLPQSLSLGKGRGESMQCEGGHGEVMGFKGRDRHIMTRVSKTGLFNMP